MRKYIYISLALSLLLHWLLIVISGHVKYERPLAEHFMMVNTRLVDLSRDEMNLPPLERQKEPKVFPDQAILDELNRENLRSEDFGQEERRLENLLAEEQLVNPPSYDFFLEEHAQATELERPGDGSGKEVSEITAPRPAIIESNLDELPPERRNLPNRVLTAPLEREEVSELLLPSLVEAGPLNTGGGGPVGLSMKIGNLDTFGVPEIDWENELAESGGEARAPGTSGNIDKPTRGLSDLPKAFDPYVDIKVYVLKDMVGNGGYFQVCITPNKESEKLHDINKDSLFIIDHSASISHKKLVEFKKGVIEAMKHLSPYDRFNVADFTSSSYKLFEHYMPATPENKLKAQKYIEKLVRVGMTDCFAGVSPFVRDGNNNIRRPLNIFLLTDGQSTVNIHESDDFLRQIAGSNPGNVSIYPFSAGKQANRELLDFLGYLNRGRKCHLEEIDGLSQQLVDFVKTHSSMIIMDLRYTVDSSIEANFFPKSLPHLYRNETLMLYGRFNDINSELVLTLTGRDATLSKRDLVFRCKYLDCAQAPDSLAKEWAGQKILYLLALKNWTSNPRAKEEYQREIKRLTQLYQVYAPY